jgi:hypothetical protein
MEIQVWKNVNYFLDVQDRARQRLQQSCVAKYIELKGQCHKIFNLSFFHESASPKPLNLPLGPFRIFSKICGDISSSKCTIDVFNQKSFNHFFTPLGSIVNA